MIVFIVFSGSIGPRIISHGLVGKDGFQVYGGAGKALLFGMLAFLLLAWRNSTSVQLKRWRWANGVWLILAVLALIGAWLGVDKLISGAHPSIWAPLVHACLLASIVFAAGSTFGPSNLRLLSKVYRRELIISLGLAVLFYGFLYIVYDLWKVLATIVLHSVRWLMAIIGIHSTIVPPRSLLFNKFGIDIAQYCSGIESIALFTALYALIGVLDWRRFNHRRYLYIFPAALLILFGLNILRVFGLILAGYYINPQIAFSLFHTYAGMLFFILYSIVFWAISYRWLLAD
ncbi:MAG TPA: archaeosortase/exosortase family protein [Verrucomicrobiae bacterium]|nr:archaeosortase/exosortase family protein [Verrucomicrobiae bacterium]